MLLRLQLVSACCRIRSCMARRQSQCICGWLGALFDPSKTLVLLVGWCCGCMVAVLPYASHASVIDLQVRQLPRLFRVSSLNST